jgi:hypothetical protein
VVKDNPKSILEVTLSAWNRSAQTVEAPTLMYWSITQLGDAKYVNWMSPEGKTLSTEGSYDKLLKQEGFQGIFVLRCACDGKTAQFWSPNMEAIKTLTEEKQLSKYRETGFTSASSLANYLRMNGGDKIFGDARIPDADISFPFGGVFKKAP